MCSKVTLLVDEQVSTMDLTHNKPIIPTSTRCARFVGILGR